VVGRDPRQALLCRRPADRVAVGRVEIRLVSMDEFPQHVALPKLYGAPAYARPATAVAHTPRPLNPDDLPIMAYMTDDEVQLLAALPAWDDRVPGAPGGGVAGAESPDPTSGSRAFSIRTFTDRIRRPHP
jgi:hypothetical protein